MKLVNDFLDYEILDMANGEKLERWGNVTLVRPDPEIIWPVKTHPELWDNVDAHYYRSNKGGGTWEVYNKKLDSWTINYKDLTFNLKLMGFKHTGLFPEQAYNWNYLDNVIKPGDKVLNLFAYTGAASVKALSLGASVVHVDSSKGMIDWAKENVKASGLEDKPIRFLVDDCIKFVKREIRRGNKYDVIILDPPSFGRGSNGEVWDINKDLYPLLNDLCELLSDNVKMVLVNSYTTGLSKTVIEDLLNLTVNKKIPGTIESDELGIKMKDSNLILPCGIYARWTKL
ncbi:MAG: class I SAM-dependent methyltransferase [Bacilli bacterium]|nr:class I SAM-dependent methyltransferase [Bacilli bacterium]